MREIKFRAWFKNEYIAGIMHEFGLGQDYFKLSAIDIETNEYENWTFEISDAIAIMQYTGLKDKNGKEIYEGDIVKSDYYHFNRITVEWNTEHWHPFSYQYGARHFEIIGNIYENPELCE